MKNFNEILKRKEALAAHSTTESEELRLDDARRVKVLSPGRLVAKRFLRNKLAIVGSCILIALFLFCFIGPLFYPYGQIQKFYKLDILENANYAAAGENGFVVIETADGIDIRLSAAAMEASQKLNQVGDSAVGATPTSNIPYYLVMTGEGYIQLYTGTSLGEFTLPQVKIGSYKKIGTSDFTFSSESGF